MWDLNLKLKKYFHKANLTKVTRKSLFVQNGFFGLRALESGYVRLSELKAINILFRKTFKKFGKIWYYINPNLLLTKKPLESRMGKGKGSSVEYVAVIQRGHIILEVRSIYPFQSLIILNKIKRKLSLSSKIIKYSI